MQNADANKNEATPEIIHKLKTISSLHNVRILMAVESGSRAWGFPSVDSDYDVRFIYARNPDDYLKLNPSNKELDDHLEDTKDYPYDIAGWDIRKTLRLLLSSNATPMEWAKSPIQYIANNELQDSLLSFAPYLNPYSLFRHHYVLACKANTVAISGSLITDNNGQNTMQEVNIVKPKKLLYALRSFLSCEWILDPSTTPDIPISIHDLAQNKDMKFKNALRNLIATKGVRRESDYADAHAVLLNYCNEMTSRYAEFTDCANEINPMLSQSNKYQKRDNEQLYTAVNDLIISSICVPQDNPILSAPSLGLR